MSGYTFAWSVRGCEDVMPLILGEGEVVECGRYLGCVRMFDIISPSFWMYLLALQLLMLMLPYF